MWQWRINRNHIAIDDTASSVTLQRQSPFVQQVRLTRLTSATFATTDFGLRAPCNHRILPQCQPSLVFSTVYGYLTLFPADVDVHPREQQLAQCWLFGKRSLKLSKQFASTGTVGTYNTYQVHTYNTYQVTKSHADLLKPLQFSLLGSKVLCLPLFLQECLFDSKR